MDPAVLERFPQIGLDTTILITYSFAMKPLLASLFVGILAFFSPLRAQISFFTASSPTIDAQQQPPPGMDGNAIQIVGMNGYGTIGLIAVMPVWETLGAGPYGNFGYNGNPFNAPYVLEYPLDSTDNTVVVKGFSTPVNPSIAITGVQCFGSLTNISVRGYVSAPGVRIQTGDEISLVFTLDEPSYVNLQSLGPTLSIFGLNGAQSISTTIYAYNYAGAGYTVAAGEGWINMVLPAGTYTAVTRAFGGAGISCLCVYVSPYYENLPSQE